MDTLGLSQLVLGLLRFVPTHFGTVFELGLFGAPHSPGVPWSLSPMKLTNFPQAHSWLESSLRPLQPDSDPSLLNRLGGFLWLPPLSLIELHFSSLFLVFNLVSTLNPISVSGYRPQRSHFGLPLSLCQS